MNFGEQIKKLRKDQNLTQQEMADKLCISRQAVSHWENDKNLPDIEMLIQMSRVFHITLDELILGGPEMNNMTEKLIRDTSETNRIKMNLLGIKIGAALLVLGFISLVAGIWAPITLEGYFGDGFTYMTLCGVLTFLIVGMKNVVDMFRSKTKNATGMKFMAGGGLLVLLGLLGYGVSLLTEAVSSYLGFAAIALGIVLMVMGALSKEKE